VYATSEPDLFRTQGYLHAQDRFGRWTSVACHRRPASGAVRRRPRSTPTSICAPCGWRRSPSRSGRKPPGPPGQPGVYARGRQCLARRPRRPGGQSLEYCECSACRLRLPAERWSPVDSLAWLKAMAWTCAATWMMRSPGPAPARRGAWTGPDRGALPGVPECRHAPIVAGKAGSSWTASSPRRPATAAARRAVAGAGRWAAQARLPRGPEPPRARSAWPSRRIGSNSWVVAGKRTASASRCCQRPHLRPQRCRGSGTRNGALHCSAVLG